MSQKDVVPVRIISTQASRVPQYTSSSSIRFSTGQMLPSSHSSRGRSSAYPRKRVMPAWVWALTSPGTRARPEPSIVSSSARGSTSWPTAAIRPSSQRTPPDRPSRVAPVTVSPFTPPIIAPRGRRRLSDRLGGRVLAMELRQGLRRVEHLILRRDLLGKARNHGAKLGAEQLLVRRASGLQALDRQSLVGDAVRKVVDHADRGVAHVELAGHGAFGPERHADEVGGARDEGDFRLRLQSRPGRLPVDPAVADLGVAPLLPSALDVAPPAVVERGDDVGALTAEDRGAGPERNEVVGADQRSHADLRVKRAHGSDRENPAAAKLAERLQVGAVIDLMRKDVVVGSVSREDDVSLELQSRDTLVAHRDLNPLASLGDVEAEEITATEERKARHLLGPYAF